MKIRRNIRMTSEPNLASSSDIAFLLIIFFMVTSAFIFKDGLQMVLPAKSKEPKVLEQDEKDKISIISVKPEGLQLNEENITLVELENKLKEKIEEDPESIVLVQVDKATRYQNVIEVVDVMKVVEVKKLSIKMNKEEEES